VGVAGVSGSRPEGRDAEEGRVDFLRTGEGLPDAYVEVKSVTLSRSKGLAEFPDSVTTRGARHMDDLARMVDAGHRAVLLYLVQRTDAEAVALASDIDPAYAQAVQKAVQAGVEVYAYRALISPQEIGIGRAMETRLV